MKMLKNKLKAYFTELISLKTKPRDIARGAAIGVFIGFLPVWGVLQFFIALFFIAILRLNKIAIILGTLVTNPLTIPFIYAVSFKFGKWLMKSEVPALTFKTLTLANVIAVAKPLLIGSVVLGLISAVVTYILTYYIAGFIYQRAKKRGF